MLRDQAGRDVVVQLPESGPAHLSKWMAKEGPRQNQGKKGLGVGHVLQGMGELEEDNKNKDNRAWGSLRQNLIR